MNIFRLPIARNYQRVYFRFREAPECLSDSVYKRRTATSTEEFFGPTVNGFRKVIIEKGGSMIHAVMQSAVLLCIDDDQDLLECEKAFLEIFGYTVLTALSGKEALELSSVHSVDVVIVDYVMPEMNGQEFAVKMKRLRPQAAIIMLSAAPDVPGGALNLVDAFIPKVCLSSQLLPMIVQLHGDMLATPSLGYDT